MLKSYDPKKVSISLADGIIDGFAEGEFLNIAYDEDQVGLTIGSDGEGARVITNILSATITVTLLQTSESNRFLNALWNQDRLTAKGKGKFNVKDNGPDGQEQASAENCWIMKHPDIVYSNGIESRAWTLQTENLDVRIEE